MKHNAAYQHERDRLRGKLHGLLWFPVMVAEIHGYGWVGNDIGLITVPYRSPLIHNTVGKETE